MDALDAAIIQSRSKNPPSKDVVSAPQASRGSQMYIIIALILASIGIWFLWRWFTGHERIVPYTQLPPFRVEYHKLPHAQVMGEISGSAPHAQGAIVTYCAVDACSIVQNDAVYSLKGYKKDIQQDIIGTDGLFSQRFRPGMYVVHIKTSDGIQIIKTPLIIEVKKGFAAQIVIPAH
jgi:hypothetical protein